MHAIGQMHEQQRTDRDNYIEILYQNVPGDQRRNFDKENTLDRTPYDVESILQYPLTVSLLTWFLFFSSSLLLPLLLLLLLPLLLLLSLLLLLLLLLSRKWR